MNLHREGFKTIMIVLGALLLVNVISFSIFQDCVFISAVVLCVSVLFYIFILRFFRNPNRVTQQNPKHIICPSDGKVVVIEETLETEYFNDKRIQVSVFMSPMNVHVNRNVIGGIVQYVKYHPGKYLVAWHPKSSTENERNTVVIADDEKQILVRQIAGKVARKIVCYSKVGEVVKQGDEFGFIKFGSRVDIFLPLNAKIKVALNQTVIGGETVIAEIE